MENIHLILGNPDIKPTNRVTKFVNELATTQTKNGSHVEVWGISADTGYNRLDRFYKTRLFMAYRNPFRLDNELKEALAEKQFDAVFHLHGGFIPAMFCTALLLKIHKVHFIFSPHGSYNTVAMQRNSFLRRAYFMVFELVILKAAKAIHVLDVSEFEDLKSIYKGTRSVVVLSGFGLRETIQSTADHSKILSMSPRQSGVFAGSL